MYSYGPPHMAGQKQDDQHEHTFSSCVRIRDVALKTCQRRWTIGRSGERGSGISELVARHEDDDDDDDDDIWINIRQNSEMKSEIWWSLFVSIIAFQSVWTSSDEGLKQILFRTNICSMVIPWIAWILPKELTIGNTIYSRIIFQGNQYGW